MEKNIGIDFGTTNTVIYTRDLKGKLKKIGGKSIKSAIYFLSKEDYIIGEDALHHADNYRHAQALVTDFKINIMEKIPIVSENGTSFKLKGEAIAKLFLNKVLSDYVEVRFKKFFGVSEMSESDKTVITVPAKFDVEKKAKIKRAAQNAMFSNVGIAFEPTAAAIAASDSEVNDDVIAVYDFGGGTFDVSVIEKGNDNHYSSLDKDGDPGLGGNTITTAIADEIILPLLNQNGVEISSDIDDMEFDEDESGMTEDEYLYNMRVIREYIETLKEYFSDQEDTYIGEINIHQNEEINAYDLTISKEQFENVIRPYVQTTVEITRRVVDKVRKSKRYVKKIIMAGGSSQLSLAEKMLREEFEGEGIDVILSDSVFDLIAKGALLMAEQQRLIHVDEKTTTQFGVGLRTGIGIKKFEKLIDVDQALPVSGSKTFKIDQNILNVGTVEIPCYEKDVKNYPESITERDKGISHINTYRIGIDRTSNPSEIQVTFTIETDGTLNLSVQLYDDSGKPIRDFNAEIMSDSEVE